MTLGRLMALSDEIRMNRSTPDSRARSASWTVPRELFLIASPADAPSSDVLVGGGVKEHLRPEIRENLLHTGLVQNVGDQGHDAPGMPQPDQFLLQSRSLGFRPLHQQQVSG